MIDDKLARQIIDSSDDFAIITLDEAGIITSWSSGAERLMGWRSDQVIGRAGRMIFTTEDQTAGSPEHEMERCRLEGRALDERFHVRADGSRFWGSGLLMPLRDGPERGYVKIVRDRTSEREAEMRFLTLADAMPGLVFVSDADGHHVQVNKRYLDFTGLDEPELLGDRWLDVIHPDQRNAAHGGWEEAIGAGSLYQGSYRLRSADGSYRCFSCRAVPERAPDGRILRWIGTCIDVEEEAKARAGLEHLNRTLEHAVTERTAELLLSYETLKAEVNEREKVEEALRQSQKMEAIGQLTGGVAHDFNNLLTVIRGSVDLLLRPGLSEAKRIRYLEAIRETSDRAAKLTGQLLAFARRQPLKAERFDVAERLQANRAVLESVTGSRMSIELDIRCQPCAIEADAAQFETAIVNMVVNARDALDGQGRIAIKVYEVQAIPALRGHAEIAGRFIAVDVTDNGSGIAAQNLGRIFEPFYTTKDVGRGTGLGLSQVFGFAKQSGGDVGVESRPDEGTTFTLFLPHAEPESIAQGTEGEDQLFDNEAGNNGCVLLVEDNQARR